jgi:transposase
MYVRTKSSPRSQNISVQIVASQRIDGKIKQNVIRHIGTIKPGEGLEQLKQLARNIIVEMKQEALLTQRNPIVASSSRFGQLSPVVNTLALNAEGLEEVKRAILGIHDVYGHVYDQIGFTNPFSNPTKRKSSASILRDIVMARIAYPDSKRASVHVLAEQFDVDIKLNHVYQMMDKIDDAFCQRIQEQALAATLRLTGEKLRVLFYDATTLYFESFTQGDLQKNGYSKDLKFNQPQVLLALFVTQRGLPVGYELFPGNTFEGHTLEVSLNKLKERYAIDQVVFVADRGMLSDHNLRFLEKNHYQYIVGAKLKSLDKTEQKRILDWLASIQQENLTQEVTHRMVVTPQTKIPVKIFLHPLAENYCQKITKQAYVLWRDHQQWTLAFYEKGQLNKTICLSDIAGLEGALSQVPQQAKRISRESRVAVTEKILRYHNKSRVLVLSYRPKRALKDRADREQSIQKLQSRLRRSQNPKQLISRYGFQKFIKVEGEAELCIDQQKLLEESQWDGVMGLYLSDPALTNEETIDHYRSLWQVEESFRIQKHDLKIRPIYHWTSQRIKAHIAIAFMAFVCVRHLEYRVATQSQKLSPRNMRDALLQYQASLIKDNRNNKTYLLPSTISSEVKEIYRVVGVKLHQGLKQVL